MRDVSKTPARGIPVGYACGNVLGRMAFLLTLALGVATTEAGLFIALDHTVIPGRVRDALANNSSFSSLSNPMNVGVHIRLVPFAIAGAITNPMWSLGGTCAPIKDYRISSCAGLGQGFLAECEEMALTTADRQQPTLDFYYTENGTCRVTINSAGTASTGR